ncbi:hypothetical protein N8I71_07180 [Roseibacterium sp. SDUM158016]|uniref:hypothetical protein n=1 Tax=Roseicyclus sediminis TaxID=2980997 RepID=UPI0021D37677|nr:hypothetical protein [Roseibacterium sp. SDUM158016]MCU4652609.1 hypothetical protein [Roseibacterium sp. SDUM158016]
MKHEQNIPPQRPVRVASGGPFHRLVEEAYRRFDRPAPRHAPGCSCALCADRAQARLLSGRAARDWTSEDVTAWLARAAGEERGRSGIQVVSRTDRAVFRFLLPRILEMLAAGHLPQGEDLGRAMAQFAPGRADSWPEAEWAFLQRFAGQMLDRAIIDEDWPLGLFETMQLLSDGGWPLQRLLRQAMADPELPAALSRLWGRAGRRDTLFPGTWSTGAGRMLCETFVSPLMVERIMNFAMADGTTADEYDAAMRAADRLLRGL